MIFHRMRFPYFGVYGYVGVDNTISAHFKQLHFSILIVFHCAVLIKVVLCEVGNNPIWN